MAGPNQSGGSGVSGRASSKKAPLRTTGKQALPEYANPSRRVFEWGALLRAIEHDDTRLRVTSFYKEAGFSMDDLNTNRKAMECMANLLTATEDWLEVEFPKRAERVSIKQIRRRMEWYLA